MPASGQSVDFPGNGNTTPREAINLAGNVTVDELSVEGNYQFSNFAITLDGNITASGSDDVIGSDLVLTQDTTITDAWRQCVDPGQRLRWRQSRRNRQAGSGHALHRRFRIEHRHDGNHPGRAQRDRIRRRCIQRAGCNRVARFLAQDRVGGISSTAGTILLSDGTSPATLTSTGNVTLDTATTFEEQIASDGNGGETDGELNATGSLINLAGATLTLSTQNSFAPASGDVITVISNQDRQRRHRHVQRSARGRDRNLRRRELPGQLHRRHLGPPT